MISEFVRHRRLDDEPLRPTAMRRWIRSLISTDAGCFVAFLEDFGADSLDSADPAGTSEIVVETKLAESLLTEESVLVVETLERTLDETLVAEERLALSCRGVPWLRTGEDEGWELAGVTLIGIDTELLEEAAGVTEVLTGAFFDGVLPMSTQI